MTDTTIPGVSAQIVEPDISRAIGTSGRIAIVGKFEKGDYDTPYFFNTPRDALRIMGNSASYPGSKIIDYVFKQDQDQSNYGATSIICVRSGATAKAVLQLKDGSNANVLLLTAVSGGTWANGASTGLKATVASGTITGKKLVLKLNGVVVETYDNCSNAELKNKINANSAYITASATSTELGRTLADVTDSSLASGTETASPTTDDLNNSLAALLEENFDILIFTDTPADAYYPVIEAWLESKLALDKPCMAILPVDDTKSVSQIITIVSSADNQLISYVCQTSEIGGDSLNVAETAARYAGFVAGLPVNESPTNKIITDIDDVLPKFSSADAYALTDKGLTLFELKNRENSKYGIISAVTGSQAVDDTGMKTDAAEIYAVRALVYVLNSMNVEDWLGRTGISKTVNALEGELNNRKNQLLKDGIVEDLDVAVSIDEANDKLAYIDISIKPYGIIKHITKRIKLEL